MRFSYCILMSAILLSGCSTVGTEYSADRSDKQTMRAYPNKTRTVTIPGWTPGGPQDTDGKPGEPNCPDCDGNGPVYIGSVRPK